MTEKRYISEQYKDWTKYSIRIIDNKPRTDGEPKRWWDYLDDFDKIVDLLNKQDTEIKRLNEKLKRCREWINSDKYDYELTLSFIKSKGFSLEDVLNYEKRKNGDVE